MALPGRTGKQEPSRHRAPAARPQQVGGRRSWSGTASARARPGPQPRWHRHRAGARSRCGSAGARCCSASWAVCAARCSPSSASWSPFVAARSWVVLQGQQAARRSSRRSCPTSLQLLIASLRSGFSLPRRSTRLPRKPTNRPAPSSSRCWPRPASVVDLSDCHAGDGSTHGSPGPGVGRRSHRHQPGDGRQPGRGPGQRQRHHPRAPAHRRKVRTFTAEGRLSAQDPDGSARPAGPLAVATQSRGHRPASSPGLGVVALGIAPGSWSWAGSGFARSSPSSSKDPT